MRRTEFITEKRQFSGFSASLLMEKDVVSCSPTDTGQDIARILTRINVGSLPVVDGDKKLAGLVSEFDLLKALMQGRDLKTLRAGEIMTKAVRTIKESTPVEEIISLLEEEHLIRVPVERDGKLVGIVARRDVLYGYIKAKEEYWP
ncbi:MAG TPA: CBS domain-containing protein [Nitrospiria bacterium]